MLLSKMETKTHIKWPIALLLYFKFVMDRYTPTPLFDLDPLGPYLRSMFSQRLAFTQNLHLTSCMGRSLLSLCAAYTAGRCAQSEAKSILCSISCSAFSTRDVTKVIAAPLEKEAPASKASYRQLVRRP